MSERFSTIEEAESEVERLELLLDPWHWQEWPIVVQLDRPVKVGKNGKELHEIVVREPVLKDLRGIKIEAQVDMDQIAKLAVKLIDNAPKGERELYAEKLPARAAGVAMRVARGFITACL